MSILKPRSGNILTLDCNICLSYMGDMQYCVLLKLIKYPTSLPFLTITFRASTIESKVVTIEKSSTMVDMMPPFFETKLCTSIYV